MRDEGEHLVAAFRWLRPVDMLIISGGGQLDDFWGGPWAHPWALFKWTLLARMRKARVVVLSVGYGTMGSRLSYFLARAAMSLSDYLSYRDTGSRSLMRRAGFARIDPVFPDLAYSYNDGHRNRSAPRSIQTVGISPIAFLDPRGWPVGDTVAYQRYLDRLADVAAWLVQTQRKVVFFASAGADPRVVDDVSARLSSRVAPSQRQLISRAPVISVEGFLEQAAQMDLVVASRLHGLLLSHLVGTPTIAISYERKVDCLMKEMQMEAFSLGIERFTLCDFQRAFGSIQVAWQEVRDQLLIKREEYQFRLQRQYDQALRVPTGAG